MLLSLRLLVLLSSTLFWFKLQHSINSILRTSIYGAVGQHTASGRTIMFVNTKSFQERPFTYTEKRIQSNITALRVKHSSCPSTAQRSVDVRSR